ncbi:cupin [Rhizobium sp. TH2]|uniref:cupin domain-containing protein n=1 Tax=Rhizobium sp. TH2 TaxID=2775403 RepID=UPI00215855BE|nr:cupin domain-containing protein [Rhizobium sp. TH2]UVC11684.1 cupin [Rhizobium sp. TH2]
MTVESTLFERSDWVPNNPTLPVLIYRRALPLHADMAAEFEESFRQNGWQGLWRNGVFSYQHYHTHAHEVLGIARGQAHLLIGGPAGRKMKVGSGDCLVLPAGTGHMRLSASDDFLVVGGYPPGQHADIRTADPGEAGLAAIKAVALPRTDPIEGRDGALVKLWKSHE